MTTAKELKKQKLRNNEYYDMQKIFDELYQKSWNNHVFKKLIPLILKDENILLAYRNLKKNSGSKTKGSDERNIYYLSRLSNDELIAKVRNKFVWYKPKAVRRVEIPKSNGKTRPLGIPAIIDRLIQQCILQILEPICEAKFYERSNGFRPNRSCEHAIAQVERYMQIAKLSYVVDIDIKGFFDNVNHGKLLKQLWTLGIRDKKLISIISAMLKSEIAGIGFPERGTPQGAILSPLLSNVVLNELDWWIASQWENIPTKKEYSKWKQSNTNKYTSLRNYTKLKECYIVRYADDFKILCRNYTSAKKIYHGTKNWLSDRLGLEISPEKSKIVNLKKNYSEFLGFKIKLQEKGKYKNGTRRYVVKSHISNKAKQHIYEKGKQYLNEMQKANDEIIYKKISLFNSYVIGTHNYYCAATHITQDLSSIALSFKRFLINRFRNRISRNGKKITIVTKERYGNSKQLCYLDGIAILPIGYIRHKKPMDKKRTINKFTVEGRKEIHKQLMCGNYVLLDRIMRNPIPYRSVEYNDNRISLYVAQKGKCAILGKILTFEEIHCHHKVPLYKGGKDNYSNLIILHKDIHKYLHATNENTLIKYETELNLNEKQRKKVEQLKELL